MPVSIDIVRRFAPAVYLSRYEKYLPCSIEHLVRGATLYQGRPNPDPEAEPPVIVQKPGARSWPVTDPGVLASHRDAGIEAYVLEINPSQYPGMPLVNGAVTAPMYYAVQDFADCVEITYVLLFAYQGGQTFKGLRAGSPFYGIIEKYGVHEGDLEEFVVRLVQDAAGGWRIAGVAYEAHGDFTWYQPGDFDTEGGEHPVVHSALSGHSLHNTRIHGFWHSEQYQADMFDIGSSLNTGIPWRPYEVTDGLKLIGLDADGRAIGDQAWAQYGGRLGRYEKVDFTYATYFDHTGLSKPDSDWVAWDIGLAKAANKIPEKFKHAIGPNGPAARRYIGPGRGYRFVAPLMVLHQGGNDGRIWFETHDGLGWTGAVYQQAVTMSENPSPVVFNNGLHVFHQGGRNNGELWYQTFDGLSRWTAHKVENLKLSGSPAAVAYRGALHVFHQGGGNSGDLWHATTGNLAAWSDTPMHAGITGSPAAAIFRDRLYLLHRGGGGSAALWWMAHDGSNWSGDQPVPNVAISGNPAAVSFRDRLYVFHQGGNNNGQLWYECFDGQSWPAAQIPNVTMSGSPAAVVNCGVLWVFFQGGHDNGELWYVTYDGITWSAATKRENVTISASPSAIVWNRQQPIPDGTYQIWNWQSKKTVDVSGGSRADGAGLIQWPPHGGPNQCFVFAYQGDGWYRITAKHSGKVLDVNGGSRDDGAKVIQWPSHNGPNQHWQVTLGPDGTYRLTARHSGKSLTVAGNDDGAPLIQYAPTNDDNQKWVLRRFT